MGGRLKSNNRETIQFMEFISNNFLDLCLTNGSDIIENIKVQDHGKKFSDHRSLTINTEIFINKNAQSKEKKKLPPIAMFQFEKAEKEQIDQLKVNLKESDLEESIDDAK